MSKLIRDHFQAQIIPLSQWFLESAKKTDVVFRLLFAPLRHVKNFGDFCACGESKVTASVEISWLKKLQKKSEILWLKELQRKSEK
jgi:hypothetical protein